MPVAKPTKRWILAIVVVLLVGGAAALITRSMHSDSPDTIQAVDLANRTYTECGGDLRTLRNGAWQQNPDQPELGTIEGFSQQYGDVTGDGKPEAIVTYDCTIGVSTAVPYVVVFEMVDGALNSIGEFDGYSPSLHNIGGRGTSMSVTLSHYTDDDARCCPSLQDEVTYTFDGIRLSQTDTQTFPAAS